MNRSVFIVSFFISFYPVLNNALAESAAEKQPMTLMTSKQLSPCPDKPNCINTEYPEHTSHYMPAITYSAAQADKVINHSAAIIQQMGGTILEKNQLYLSATFTSFIFKFVDDFEIRNDIKTHQIHIRSASRIGYSDFGVNKKRVKKFTRRFNQTIKGDINEN